MTIAGALRAYRRRSRAASSSSLLASMKIAELVAGEAIAPAPDLPWRQERNVPLSDLSSKMKAFCLDGRRHDGG